jgi:Camelysin metallo-endopeptidase
MNRFLNTRVVSGVLVLALAAAGTAVITTGALGKDFEMLGPNSWATGTIDLSMDAAAVPFAVTGMAPGDVAYQAIPLANAGDLPLRYAMASTGGTGALAEELSVVVKAQPTGSDNCRAGAAFDGTATTVGPVPLGVSAGGPGFGFGSSVDGAQPGDRDLAAGTGEILCVQVTYPANAVGFDGQSVSGVAFMFAAEQTTNNP